MSVGRSPTRAAGNEWRYLGIQMAESWRSFTTNESGRVSQFRVKWWARESGLIRRLLRQLRRSVFR
jgi:hypothetical protein